MPNRILKDSICTSETIHALTPEQEVFFYRLIVQCDDYGRFHAKPSLVLAACYPLLVGELPVSAVADRLDALERHGLIRRYTYDGKPYLYVTTWERHQQVRTKRSKYPPIDIMHNHLIAPDIKCNQVISSDTSRARAESNPIQSESESISIAAPSGPALRDESASPSATEGLFPVEESEDDTPAVEDTVTESPVPDATPTSRPVLEPSLWQQVHQFSQREYGKPLFGNIATQQTAIAGFEQLLGDLLVDLRYLNPDATLIDALRPVLERARAKAEACKRETRAVLVQQVSYFAQQTAKDARVKREVAASRAPAAPPTIADEDLGLPLYQRPRPRPARQTTEVQP